MEHDIRESQIRLSHNFDDRKSIIVNIYLQCEDSTGKEVKFNAGASGSRVRRAASWHLLLRKTITRRPLLNVVN